MIYVSFPRTPDDYLQDCRWHAQLSHHVYHGLRSRFGRLGVEFVGWDSDIPAGPTDLVVTCLPNRNYRSGARIIGVENDTLIPERWTQATADIHGLTVQVDDIAALHSLVDNAVGLIVMTNDVALGRLRANEARAASHAAWLSRACNGNIGYTPHPIDHQRFRRIPKLFLNRKRLWNSQQHRMMVYHAGWRKNSAEAITILEGLGLVRDQHFDVVDTVDKNDPQAMAALVERYNVIFSGSFSESGPINMIEYLVQGFVIAGHEEWWGGYGFVESVWSYDPALRDEMTRRMAWLMNPRNVGQMQQHRDRILQHFLTRDDMRWETFLERLGTIIRHAL
ncbi:hypothetical protein AAFN86_18240 [Roseomonas sp. CAU 1739]|uniref:hypothetical protein n=1 Tax=Roseomonas sp. CAU 1739 TaxID=3140364 RepID=UPI00325A9032